MLTKFNTVPAPSAGGGPGDGNKGGGIGIFGGILLCLAVGGIAYLIYEANKPQPPAPAQDKQNESR